MFQRFSKIAVIATIFTFSFFKASAQNELRIPVGTQPAEIIRVGDDLHVFCSGADLNFDKTFNEGEVPASWWILNANTLAVKSSKIFEGEFLPYAPMNIRIGENATFLIMNNKVKKYDTETQEMISESFVAVPTEAGSIIALFTQSAFGTEFLSVVTRPSLTSAGLIFTADASNGGVELDVDTVGINPLQVWSDVELMSGRARGIVLNEGLFGQGNSTITLSSNTEEAVMETTLPLGDGANFFQVEGDSVYVVVNGSHQVVVIDMNNQAIVKTIATGTEAFNGPREAAIWGNYLLVTTYNNDIRVFDIPTGNLINTIPVSGKVDPIQIYNGKVIAGITLKNDYSADNALAILNLDSVLSYGTSVAEEKISFIVSAIAPNPIQASGVISATFPSETSIARIEIIAPNGVSVGEFTTGLHNGELRYVLNSDELGLSQGQYLAKITAGSSISILPFVVVK
ncbi:MAG TPA: hypothetical protein VEC36_06640 [Patescibacteria group bacterium]|nr:hypothetical protein [Patescibacteria group bacterium]